MVWSFAQAFLKSARDADGLIAWNERGGPPKKRRINPPKAGKPAGGGQMRQRLQKHRASPIPRPFLLNSLFVFDYSWISCHFMDLLEGEWCSKSLAHAISKAMLSLNT